MGSPLCTAYCLVHSTGSGEGAYIADRGIGGIFLNFMLSEEVRPLCGIDMEHVRTEE